MQTHIKLDAMPYLKHNVSSASEPKRIPHLCLLLTVVSPDYIQLSPKTCVPLLQKPHLQAALVVLQQREARWFSWGRKQTAVQTSLGCLLRKFNLIVLHAQVLPGFL